MPQNPLQGHDGHTSSPKAQSGNDTNSRIVTGYLPITKFMFRVVR